MPAPRLLYEPVMLRADEDGMIVQAGAFPSEAEAQKVLDIWRGEGRREPLAINIVPVFDSAEQWQADR
jgi:hypothetical protein